MIEQGVAGENLRKIFSGDDSGVKVGDSGKVADALVQSIFGTKLRKPIDKILGDHRLYTPFTTNNNPMYILTLPEASEIMTAQGGEQVEEYKLENLELSMRPSKMMRLQVKYQASTLLVEVCLTNMLH